MSQLNQYFEQLAATYFSSEFSTEELMSCYYFLLRFAAIKSKICSPSVSLSFLRDTKWKECAGGLRKYCRERISPSALNHQMISCQTLLLAFDLLFMDHFTVWFQF